MPYDSYTLKSVFMCDTHVKSKEKIVTYISPSCSSKWGKKELFIDTAVYMFRQKKKNWTETLSVHWRENGWTWWQAWTFPLKILLLPYTADWGLKFQLSSFKFSLPLKRNFNAWLWTFYGGAWNARITGTISGICCDLSRFWLWFVGLWAYWLRCRSEHVWNDFMHCTVSALKLTILLKVKIIYE
jgi:hypothetical protein